MRLSNRGLPPFFGAGIRFLAASVLLFGWVLVRRLPLPTRRELPGTLLFGLLGFAGFFAFGYWVASRISALAGEGQVMVSSTVSDLTAGSGIAFEDAGLHELKGWLAPGNCIQCVSRDAQSGEAGGGRPHVSGLGAVPL